jgi:hypothetical protein
MMPDNFQNRLKENYKAETRLAMVVSIAYFFVAIAEIMSELFYYTPVIVICKPLMPILLLVLYWLTSPRRNPLFFVAMFLSSIVNTLFIPDDPQMLFYGVIIFMFHRIIVLYMIFKLVKLTDYVPVAIATVPFLLGFSYLLASSPVPDNSFVLLVIQNIMISVLGGIALSNYMMNDNKKNSWLLICGLLFVVLQFIVFIEKYYLTGLSPMILRPIAMALNAFAFYTFYEFVLAIERSDNDSTTAGG